VVWRLWAEPGRASDGIAPATTAAAHRASTTATGWTRPWSQRQSGHRQLAEVVWRYGHGWDRAGRSAWLVSGRCGRAGDLVPRGESVGHFASVFLVAEPVAAWPEVWRDAAERGQEPLGVPG
jgi:hypothetical protein